MRSGDICGNSQRSSGSNESRRVLVGLGCRLERGKNRPPSRSAAAASISRMRGAWARRMKADGVFSFKFQVFAKPKTENLKLARASGTQKPPDEENALDFRGAGFCGGGSKRQPQPDLIARIHFAGAEAISADTNHLAFTNLFCSAEARALESQTLDKLSRAPGAWFKSKLAARRGRRRGAIASAAGRFAEVGMDF